jgi:hypothetical protein
MATVQTLIIVDFGEGGGWALAGADDGSEPQSVILSALSAVKLNDPVSPPKLTGVYSISCNKPAGWWTTGHTAFVLGGAAAAAGLAFGISDAVSGGSPVSPSH